MSPPGTGSLPSASQMEPMANVTAVLVLQSIAPLTTLAASVSAGVVDVGHSAVGSGTRQTPSLLPLEHAVQYTPLGAAAVLPATIEGQLSRVLAPGTGSLPSASQTAPMANSVLVTAPIVRRQSGAFVLASSVNASVVDVGHSAAVASGTRHSPSLLPLEHAVQYMVLARLRRAPALGSSTRTVTVTSRVDTWQVSHVRWQAACFAHCTLFAAIAAAVGAKLALPPGAKRGIWAVAPPTPRRVVDALGVRRRRIGPRELLGAIDRRAIRELARVAAGLGVSHLVHVNLDRTAGVVVNLAIQPKGAVRELRHHRREQTRAVTRQAVLGGRAPVQVVDVIRGAHATHRVRNQRAIARNVGSAIIGVDHSHSRGRSNRVLNTGSAGRTVEVERASLESLVAKGRQVSCIEARRAKRAARGRLEARQRVVELQGEVQLDHGGRHDLAGLVEHQGLKRRGRRRLRRGAR
eukprot:scaffold102581_cov57-Phaeocystis_antarctica.AAC.2